MTPTTRFRIWTTLVVTLVFAQHAWLALSPLPATPHIAVTLFVYLLLLALAGLLATTPGDAVRLPVRTSVVLLAAITGLAYAHAWWHVGPSQADAPAVVAIVAAVWMAADSAARRGVSPWAAVVPVWIPWLTGPKALPALGAMVFVCVWLIAFRVATPRRD